MPDDLQPGDIIWPPAPELWRSRPTPSYLNRWREARPQEDPVQDDPTIRFKNGSIIQTSPGPLEVRGQPDAPVWMAAEPGFCASVARRFLIEGGVIPGVTISALLSAWGYYWDSLEAVEVMPYPLQDQAWLLDNLLEEAEDVLLLLGTWPDDELIPLLTQAQQAQNEADFTDIAMGAKFGCDCGCGGDSLTDDDYADQKKADAQAAKARRALVDALKERGYAVLHD